MFITVKCYREEKFIGWLGTDNTYQYCLVDDISKADIYSISDKQNAENDAETYLYSNIDDESLVCKIGMYETKEILCEDIIPYWKK